MAKLTAEYTYSPAELLDLCNESIARVNKIMQEGTIEGRRAALADLNALMAQRDKLLAEVRAESGMGVNYARKVFA